MGTQSEHEWVTCSCCGRAMQDTPRANVSFDETPYPHDCGYGLCVECGGDVKAKNARKRLGWAACAFYDARIAMLLERLSDTNRARFKAMSYERKCAVVAGLVEKGTII